MYFIGQHLLALLCIAPASPADHRQEWELWFARYDAVPSEQRSYQPALFIFRERFVPAVKGSSIDVVQRYDIGGPFDIYKQNGAYFAGRLPLFAPTADKMSIRGGEFDCEAVAEMTGYAVTCRSNYSGYSFRSFYHPRVGVSWFEYFCGHPKEVCRFEFAEGKMLFSQEFFDALERSGDIRTDEPSRP
jgi:hypothetical protein